MGYWKRGGFSKVAELAQEWFVTMGLSSWVKPLEALFTHFLPSVLSWPCVAGWLWLPPAMKGWEPTDCSTSLIYYNAILHCYTTWLHYTCVVLWCTALVFYTVLLHCTAVLTYTSVPHCTAVQQDSELYLHCCTTLHCVIRHHTFPGKP